jgi:porphobilinogen deaminase
MAGFKQSISEVDIQTIKTETDKIPTVLTNQEQLSKLLYKSISFAATDGTIDLAIATDGDIYVEDVLIYSLTDAADLVSVSIQTDDAEPFVVMSDAEGALANLTAETTIKTANSQKSFYLVSGKKLQYTINTAGDWSGYVVIKYKVISSGSLV